MSQVLASTRNSIEMFQGNTYTYWCGQNCGFGSYHKVEQQQLAQHLLKCLGAPVGNLRNIFQSYHTDSLVSNIMQFLVATQTTEACYGRNTTYARTMGMNKLGRKQLRSIQKGASTFLECFVFQQYNIGAYPPAGRDGC
jgi:hypothetical protein